MQFGEHVERARAAHAWTAAAEYELLRLHEKLDLADAAASELDVMPGDGHLFVPTHRVNLALHRVNVGDRGVIEIFAPDERRQFLEKPCADRPVAGDRAGLDHRGPLPV